ncbi:origin recognition complex subunit 6 [Zerene cesonia]|uniref:origin recognition complex subunit 6 n=1 Tax=Zerene cesonia TaxID=33412 RepID=UPI0018E55328|nr:origin recognition complex subunit 6 [Zerene cesonia]XP_038218343.1 origin recognition complex subunit 6 [Zerene cesonia]
MASSKTLQLLATKLGLAEEARVISKAAEFERLLQTKTTAGYNLTDTSKVVICLDLATSILNADLDQKTAIKYSGLKAPSYNNCRKVIENLLELNNDNITVSSLCLIMQCTGVQTLAESILAEYQKVTKMEMDLTLPQYVCMAVYQACRINKVKIAKSKLIEKSRLKPGQWSKLDAEWTKIVDEKFTTVKKRGRPRKVTIVNDEQQMELDTGPKDEKSCEPKIEPYEQWKQRMLEQAYEELKELERRDSVRQEKEMLSPRRSPRKTPQKFSPYKSPKKSSAGIRLLFPKDL